MSSISDKAQLILAAVECERRMDELVLKMANSLGMDGKEVIVHVAERNKAWADRLLRIEKQLEELESLEELEGGPR